MTEKILRKYLEITSFEDFREVEKLSENYYVKLVDPCLLYTSASPRD